VSLRNPQLTETKERNLGFIHRPKGATGIFDDAVSSRGSKTLKLYPPKPRILLLQLLKQKKSWKQVFLERFLLSVEKFLKKKH